MTSQKYKFFGFGNIDRQDDGVGIVLASRLAFLLDAELSTEHQLLPELVYELEGVDVAVFVDADMQRHENGYSLREIEAQPKVEGLNIHSMGPGWLLELAKNMNMSPKRAILLSVSGVSFDFSNELTPECKKNAKNAEEAFLAQNIF